MSFADLIRQRVDALISDLSELELTDSPRSSIQAPPDFDPELAQIYSQAVWYSLLDLIARDIRRLGDATKTPTRRHLVLKLKATADLIHAMLGYNLIPRSDDVRAVLTLIDEL